MESYSSTPYKDGMISFRLCRNSNLNRWFHILGKHPLRYLAQLHINNHYSFNLPRFPIKSNLPDTVTKDHKNVIC